MDCSNSFVASSNCGLYCGAKIDFVDINKEHFNIDLKELEKIKKKSSEGPCNCTFGRTTL